MQFTIQFRASSFPLTISLSSIFAGQKFDPYTFNPAYKKIAQLDGRPEFPSSNIVLADYERGARLINKASLYYAEQSLIKPYIVMREGTPRFPMLIGSVNSILWYGLDPYHGIEFFHTQQIVRKDDVIFDCGAHAGQMAAYFAATSGAQGKVFAFDPFENNCLQIQAQDKLGAEGRIQVIHAGVGARRSNVQVSILGQMTIEKASVGADDLIYIKIVPIDDYIENAPTFIKLDVEGAEVDALIGASKTLATHRPRIFVEVHTHMIGRFGYNLTDFFAAIPQSIYDIDFKVEGLDENWRRFVPGLEIGVTAPLLVFAFPKTTDP